jgi:hypothetical protein
LTRAKGRTRQWRRGMGASLRSLLRTAARGVRKIRPLGIQPSPRKQAIDRAPIEPSRRADSCLSPCGPRRSGFRPSATSGSGSTRSAPHGHGVTQDCGLAKTATRPILDRISPFDLLIPTGSLHRRAFLCKVLPRLGPRRSPAAPEGPGFASGEHATPRNDRFRGRLRRHFSRQTSAVIENCSTLCFALSRRRRQHRDLRQHAREQPPRQMTLRQQRSVVTCVLDQPAAGLH